MALSLVPKFLTNSFEYEALPDAVDCFSVRYSPDGAAIATSYADGTIRLFNATSGTLEQELAPQQAAQRGSSACPTPVRQRQILADANGARDAATAGGAGKPGVLPLDGDASPKSVDGADDQVPEHFHRLLLSKLSAAGDAPLSAGTPGMLQITYPTTQLRWRPMSKAAKAKNVLLSVNAESDGRTQHWHSKSGKCLHTVVESHNQVYCCDFFKDGSLFATAGSDRTVRVYDEQTRQVTAELHSGEECLGTCGHSNRVFSLVFGSSPHTLISGGWDNTVQLWDTRVGHSVRSIFGVYCCGDSLDVAPNDSNTLFAGSWRAANCLQTFDLGSGELIQNVPWRAHGQVGADQCMLFATRVSHGGSLLAAAGSQDNECKLFRIAGASLEPLCSVITPKPIFSVDFSPDDKNLAICGADGRMRTYDVLKK